MIPGSENLDLWKGEKGGCPHCHGNNFYIFPGTNHAVCELCGLEGHLEIGANGVTLVMTAVGLKMGGQPMNIYWFAFLGTLPKMLIAAYISVLIFLPLSMKVSGMDKLGGPPPKG